MHRYPPLPIRQRGAILVVSLLLLLVMTVLALTASQTTRLQERMAGNARDLDLAFQAGEAGLRRAETRIDKTVAPKGGSPIECSTPADCDAVSRLNATQDYVHQTQEWWDDNSHALSESLAEVIQKPQFVTEVWANVSDTLTVGGPSQKSGTVYYVNTAKAAGATSTAVSVVETTYAVRY